MSDPSDPPDPADPAPSIDPELMRAMASVGTQLTDLPGDLDLLTRFEWVVDVLIRRGLLTEGHRKMLGRVRPMTSGVQLSSINDKHAVPDPGIDCESLLHLCKGRCCTFRVELSRADVVEGKLGWVIEEPYLLPRGANGYCQNLDEDARCTVYEDRPGHCRIYDCRHDTRVWIDYEQRIPAPLQPRVIPLASLVRPRKPTPV